MRGSCVDNLIRRERGGVADLLEAGGEGSWIVIWWKLMTLLFGCEGDGIGVIFVFYVTVFLLGVEIEDSGRNILNVVLFSKSIA